MQFYKIISIITLCFLISACDTTSTKIDNGFSIVIEANKKHYSSDASIQVSLLNMKDKKVDSITYRFENSVLSKANGNTKATISFKDQKIGIQQLVATIFSEEKTYTASKDITILPTTSPVLYTYKILETYEHDQNAYTQGLEFKGETLYESTGKYGKSSVRKTNYETGEVLQKTDLKNSFFGEGLTILNENIYQLTWQEKVGFIYDLNSFNKKATFAYTNSKEGWGLCNDGNQIYKSDGTEKIWTLNAETLAEEGYIQIYINTGKIKSVNELEWVDGKLYANIYQKSAIAIINPKNGAVEGVIDLSDLIDNVTKHEELDVLNGIAYKGEPNILYVTGKNWDKLFKIEVLRE